mmetsp:Transcript_25557/g.81793  ORF Transcript_25557/g.81793 Transcript_25557/m.81793 type:complete len:310 (+) Transcript_25557:97-1026(+)
MLLRLVHERAKRRHVAAVERRHRRPDNALVDRAEQLVHASLRIVIGDRVALCEPLQDDRRVLCAVQLDDDQVQRALERQLLAVESVAVEGHQHRPRTKGAALVHPAALRRRRDLAVVPQVHLSAHRQLEVVHAVEGAGGEDAGGGGGGEALSRGKVRLVVVQHQPRHVAAHQDLVRHAGHVREVVAGRRGGKESLRIHRELCGPADVATLVDRGDNQLGRVPARPRVQALVGARHEAHAGQQRRVEAPVRAGPVGMLAHEADAARDKELYRALRGHVLLEIFNRAEGHCDRSRAKAKAKGKATRADAMW